MKTHLLNQIEETIKKLSIEEQLFIIERVANIIRENTLKESILKKELAAMANDIEIQKEVSIIEQEFIYTELDGLENN